MSTSISEPAMSTDQYGPFASVVGIACALVATFSLLLLKMLGGMKRWSWLAGGSPPFLITGGARVMAVALMALTYVTITAMNYRWFAGAAVLTALIGFVCLIVFDRLRQTHVVAIPLVGADGTALRDSHGREQQASVVIGSESKMREEARLAFERARKESGVSLRKFMSGYGSPPNDPGAIWDDSLLAKTGNRLTTLLMCFVLLAVLTLFLAALSIDVRGRASTSGTSASSHSLTIVEADERPGDGACSARASIDSFAG